MITLQTLINITAICYLVFGALYGLFSAASQIKRTHDKRLNADWRTTLLNIDYLAAFFYLIFFTTLWPIPYWLSRDKRWK